MAKLEPVINSPNHIEDRLQQLLDDFVHGQRNVRGGLLLVDGPGFQWKGAAGWAVPEQGRAMEPDDPFVIDSIAKTMTATLVMLQTEHGLLNLDDRIGHYLPSAMIEGLHVFEGQSYGETITIRQLLNRTSGIIDDWAIPEFFELIVADSQRRWTPEETIQFVKENSVPAFPPGQRFNYSDPGYNLLGLILEGVTGMALQEIYREQLLGPLGMSHTYRPSHEEPNYGVGFREPSHRYLDDMECTLLPAVMTADWAGGGLISTANDLKRFMRAFVDDKIFERSNTRQMMFDWVNSGPFHSYGLGISRVALDHSDRADYKGLGEIWGHAGSSDNFLYYWPTKDTILTGTLNQIACEREILDNMARVLRLLLDYQPWESLT